MSERIIRFLGSIKFAVPLLSGIIGILIWATFYESQVGSSTVQQTVYKSPWFGGLMFLLALNLGISALSRYPWRGARKVGFALTHLGLIVIIAGSAAVIHLGVEGMLLLRIDNPPNSQIRVEGELLDVMNADGSLQHQDLFIKSDGSVYPQSVGNLSIVGYSENTIKTVSFTDEASVNNPAVKLRLNSQRMGQTLERWLGVAPVAYAKVPVGPAELEIIAVEDNNQLQKLLTPPIENNSHPWGTVEVKTANKTINIDVAKTFASNKKSRKIPQDNLTVEVVNFWPDFILNRDNQPTTASQQFNNPVVQLQATTPTTTERWFVFAKGYFPPIRTVISGESIAGIDISYQVLPQTAEDYFHVLATPDNQLFYTAHSSKGFKSGELKLGEAVSPGWADFQITLDEWIPHGKIQRQIVPVSNTVGNNIEGVPALFVQTENGTEAALPWAEPTTIDDTNGDIFAVFSPKILQLPFAVALEDFIVERNEGSESVAMWTSQIEILDPETGEISQRNVWMNHPTWYRGWKLAQASWNPGDLNQSTLQVKREPAWVTALTWTGSALVIGGIGVMFYGPGIAKQFRSSKAKTASVEPHPEVIEVEDSTPEKVSVS
ncbi:MAG: cytochrome c biogenesis protein ResB [Microcoleaceae cyanobacterium]